AGTRAGGNKVQASSSVKFGGRRRPNASEDNMISKTVRIQQGQWKGYVGIVVNATDTHVSVELHSRLKKVNVLRNKVKVVGDKYGGTDQDQQNAAEAAAASGNSHGLTPFMGSSTPQLGGMTPMNPGGLTPGGAGGMTPLNATHYGDGDDEENVWIPGGLDGATPTTASSTPLSAENGSQSAGWTPTSGNDTDNNTPGWTPQTDMTPQSEISTPHGDSTPTTHDSSSNYTPVSMSSVTPVGTPGGETENAWFIERVHVTLSSDPFGESYVLVGVNALNNTARCVGSVTGAERVVRVDEVKGKVDPGTNDRVLVFQGALVGSEGDLVCIDGNDAIFKTETGDFKIVDVKDVAKIGSAEA
ncbi:hypothetical protein TrRE_jg785, partial [Triparma retinervis]